MKIGLVLPMTEARDGLPPYAALRSYSQQAESLGLDSLWVSDHVLLRLTGQSELRTWEAWTVLAALTEATHRVQLGPLVLCAPFRNPALLARMAFTLAEVSGSRLVLGMGAGWHLPEFEYLGLCSDRLLARFEQYLVTLHPLLNEPSAPPLLVGGQSPRLLEAAARFADYWNTSWLDGPEQVADRRRAVELACRKVGRDPQSLAITVGANIRPPGQTAEAGSRSSSIRAAADLLSGYRDAGVAHLMCSLHPLSPETLSWFALAVGVYRRGTRRS